jgi:hypothetical protein
MKNPKILTLALVSTLLLVATCAIMNVNGQSDATVTVLDSEGGTVDPSGTTTYADGTDVALTATPDSASFVFVNWLVTTDEGSSTITDNPLTLTVAGGVTYTIQAVFTVIQAAPGSSMPSDMSKAAVVVILPSAGGITNPPAGTYALADVSNMNIQAIPQEGWQFAHWTICGTNTNHGGAPTNWAPTDNPYNINHGYGYTYYYQAVFTQIGTSEPGASNAPVVNGVTIAGTASDILIIALVVVIALVLIVFGVYALRRKK